MSKGLLGGAVGAGIGYFLGGATGARIGWTLGSFLFAEKTPGTEGPRLESTPIEALDYGTPIPIIFGRGRPGVFRMWQRQIREVRHEEDAGGKGGGGAEPNVTYSYYGTWAVGICEGPIAGVRKIWADSILIYDAGDTTDIGTIVASNAAAKKIRIYNGSTTQLPDSLIQATEGAANVPAYRNTAYIVFDDWPLEKHSGRIPNISVEVLSSGYSTGMVAVDQFELSGAVNYWKSSALYANDDYMVLFKSRTNLHYTGLTDVYNVFYNGNQVLIGSFISVNEKSYYLSGQSDVPALATSNYPFGDKLDIEDIDGNLLRECDVPAYAPDRARYHKLGDYEFLMTDLSGYSIVYDVSESVAKILYTSSPATPTGQLHCIYLADYIYGVSTAKIFICFDYTWNILWTVDISGWLLVTPDHANVVLVRSNGNSEAVIYTARKFARVNENGYTDLGTVASFARGVGERGGHHLIGDLYIKYESTLNILDTATIGLTPTLPTLGDIVTAIDVRAGLTAGDIVVTELTDEVDGYIINGNMSARAATEPLQKAYLFDGAEFNNKINYIKRGGASILTIPQIDLGAGVGGPSYALKQDRMQESELPSDVTIGYISAVRDYEVATQRAQRINYSTQNIMSEQLPIVLSNNKALQISEITLFNAHVEKERFNFSLTNEYIDLNPTNVVTVVYGDDARVARLTKISYGDVLECEAVSDDPQSYTSAAIAADESWTGQTIALSGPTRIEYMDIPILRNADNDSGMYFSASGYYSSWTGTQIFKSLDEGITYNAIDAIFTPATIGSATTALADASTAVWDRVSTITVDLIYGSLSSATEENVIRGSNYLLIGSEIIQFANATLNADETYTVDTLLRGRRGTEWATGTHAIGERVVLLSESTLGRFDAIIGTERTYKAVSIGKYIDSATATLKTNTGVALKPFSIAYVKGERDGSNNLTITWMRRSRYIGSPLWTRPVFEDSEAYEIDVMSGSTVLRTISVTAATASYTAAQQTADGLTPGNPVTINAYQMSGTIGRGYVAEATI